MFFLKSRLDPPAPPSVPKVNAPAKDYALVPSYLSPQLVSQHQPFRRSFPPAKALRFRSRCAVRSFPSPSGVTRTDNVDVGTAI